MYCKEMFNGKLKRFGRPVKYHPWCKDFDWGWVIETKDVCTEKDQQKDFVINMNIPRFNSKKDAENWLIQNGYVKQS